MDRDTLVVVREDVLAGLDGGLAMGEDRES
jgi:hypothetical protein